MTNGKVEKRNLIVVVPSNLKTSPYYIPYIRPLLRARGKGIQEITKRIGRREDIMKATSILATL
jgi:hypothetical protein